jgi:hypothetical protein
LPERSNAAVSEKRGLELMAFNTQFFSTHLQDGWENEKEGITTTKPDTKKSKIETFLSIPAKC